MGEWVNGVVSLSSEMRARRRAPTEALFPALERGYGLGDRKMGRKSSNFSWEISGGIGFAIVGLNMMTATGLFFFPSFFSRACLSEMPRCGDAIVDKLLFSPSLGSL